MLDPSTPVNPPTITIGATTVELVEPPSLFALACLRTPEQAKRGGDAETRAYAAAALRMSWPPKKTWPVRVRPQDWRPGVDVAGYGYDVWEALRRETKGTVHIADLTMACLAALNFAGESAITLAELDAARDFSEDQGEE